MSLDILESFGQATVQSLVPVISKASQSLYSSPSASPGPVPPFPWPEEVRENSGEASLEDGTPPHQNL